MSRGPDVATQLERALVKAAAGAGVDIAIVAADWTRWASVTFAGARHRLRMRAAPSNAVDAWVDGLSDFEFTLRGHLIADLLVAGVERDDQAAEIEIEVLTVED